MAKKRTIQWDKVDALGSELGTLDPVQDRDRRLALEGELFGLLLSYCDEKQKTYIGRFYEQFRKSYDPAKGPLSHFFKRTMSLLKRTQQQEDRAAVRRSRTDPDTGEKIREYEYHSSLNQTVGENADTELQDFLPDDGADSAEDHLIHDDLAAEAVSLMLSLPQRLHGRANNPTRLEYFRMFFTDGMVGHVQRTEEGRRLQKHERDLLEALHLEFMDFFMLRQCRTVPQIALCPRHLHSELVEGKPQKRLTDPMPADVYKAFRAKQGKSASDAAVSNHRKAYRELRNLL